MVFDIENGFRDLWFWDKKVLETYDFDVKSSFEKSIVLMLKVVFGDLWFWGEKGNCNFKERFRGFS